jgi:tetratricopeptide (TPR) repeat protein
LGLLAGAALIASVPAPASAGSGASAASAEPAASAGAGTGSAESPPGCAAPAVLAHLAYGDFERALREAETCRGTPDYARLKGQAFHGLFQADSALLYLRKAHKEKPDDAVAVALAEALIWRKQDKEAGRLLDAVKDKGTPAYFKAMAARYESRRKFSKAVEMYDKAIALEKVSHGTRFRKAMALSWMKNLEASIALYTELIESPAVPPDLKTRSAIRRAEVRAWDGDMEKAVEELKQVVAKQGRNVEARLQLGQVLEWSGRFKEAKDQYRDALVADPANATAKARLEELLWVK